MNYKEVLEELETSIDDREEIDVLYDREEGYEELNFDEA